tara:strand:+ start:28 stop:1299 length:1272 start_codon:yes stop_codon:yes gene_type:complete
MNNFLNKILNINKFSNKNKSFLEISKSTDVAKIFKAISNYNEHSEIRYVGGCVRKILNDEKFDDIDLATNINPNDVKECLKDNNIKFYETGIEHGTITANIEKKNYEITSLRKDILTDGRHAIVEFTYNWNEDASRRDFTINCIYADKDGNLFDPYDGLRDLKNGIVNFIGNPDKRIKEDYLRILRYIRFFLNYSKEKHQKNIKKIIKQNIKGVINLSKERLLIELKKIIDLKNLIKLSNDEFCKEIVLLIFPQLKNLDKFKKINNNLKSIIKNKDFIFLLSILIIDETDNSEYFLFKFNVSNENKNRIRFLKENYIRNSNYNIFTKEYLQKIFYFNGRLYLEDLIDFHLIKSNRINKKIFNLRKYFEKIQKPEFPIKAKLLMEKYNIKEGKELGQKLKSLENLWIENNFKISNKEIEKVFLS